MCGRTYQIRQVMHQVNFIVYSHVVDIAKHEWQSVAHLPNGIHRVLMCNDCVHAAPCCMMCMHNAM